MKLIHPIMFSTLGLVFPMFTFAQVIATDVQCSPPGCVGTIDLASGAVTTQKIKDNTIMNVDIGTIAAIDPSKIAGVAWTGSTDGSDSGLDADLLDGISSSQFLRSDQGLSIDAYGRVGIGTATPENYLLHLAGSNGAVGVGIYLEDTGGGGEFTLRSDAGNFVIDDAVNMANRFIINSSGNTGIGTTSPNQKLQVSGGSIKLDNNRAMVWRNAGNDGDVGVILYDNSNKLHFRPGATEQVTIDSNGSVGIGTTNPSRDLEVVGNGIMLSGSNDAEGKLQVYKGVLGVSANELLRVDPADWNTKVYALSVNEISGGNFGGIQTAYITNSGNAYFAGNLQNNGNVALSAGNYNGSGPTVTVGDGQYGLSSQGGYLRFWNQTPGGGMLFNSNGADRMILTSEGTVGINKLSPNYQLDVNGGVNGTQLCINGDCRGTWPEGGGGGGVGGDGTSGYLAKWVGSTTIDDSLVYINGSNVGISTTSPTQKLDVNGSVAVNNTLYGPAGTSLTLQAASDRALIFNTNGGNERMRIDKDGNVGIGTTSPSTKLAVSGKSTLTATGNSWAAYVTSPTASDNEGAVYAEATDTGAHNTVGVWGVTKATGTASGQPIGVRGDARANNTASGQFGVLGYSYYGGTGVWGGAVGVPGGGNEAAYGTIDTILGNGVAGETFSRHDGAAGLWGTSRATDGWGDGVYGETHSPKDGSYGVFSSGPFAATGTKSAVVYTDSQGPTELFVQESPDNWFEDIGSSQLQNGYAKIQIDPLFLETVTIDSTNPYHVFVEAYDNIQGQTLNVRKSGDYFEVTNPVDPQSSLVFSYRIIAKRKYYENQRMTKVPVTIDQFMRPDLTTPELIDLNKRWELDYTNLLNKVGADQPATTPADQ